MPEDIMDKDKQPSPWRIHGKEFEVPKSKMGKAHFEADMDKERMTTEKSGEEEKSMEKSLEKLADLAKYNAPARGDEAIDLLKACKASMDKGAESEEKAYLGEIAIPEKQGAKPKFTGEGAMPAGEPAGGGGKPKPGTEKVAEQQWGKATPIPIPVTKGAEEKDVAARKNKAGREVGASDKKRGTTFEPQPTDHPDWASGYKQGAGMPSIGKAQEKEGEKENEKGRGKAWGERGGQGFGPRDGRGGRCSGREDEPVDKAMTSRSVPRIPPAMRQEMIRRNAQSVMTRGNSRFAKDIHTGPLTGEVVDEIEDDAMRRTTQEVYKSCNMCGRRFMEKSFPEGCPTCSMNKSNHCSVCGTQLVKSHGGSVNCPLCG